MTTETSAYEILEAMMPIQERLGSQEALHAGIVALQAAVDSGEAIKIGTNIVGAEVDIDECFFGDRMDVGAIDDSEKKLSVNSSLIVGKGSKVRVGQDGALTGSYVDNSVVELSRGRIVRDSSIVNGSRVVDTHMFGSTANHSTLQGIAMWDSHFNSSKVIRAHYSEQGKSGTFVAVESRVENYDDTSLAADQDIKLLGAIVTKTEDVYVAQYHEVTVHPDKEGNSVYVLRDNSYPTLKEVLKAMPWLKRKERKELERELKELEQK